MNLLLDEMHAAAVASALRARSFDIVAVTEIAELRGTADADLLVWAAAHQRAIVTENIRDFVPLAQRWAAAGQDHAGLVFTNPRRFHRATLAYPGTLIDALATWLPTAPDSAPSMVWWL
ncbi:MAG: DUF5615 family PIN-like protein [Microthrixaceae bacterium]|nr:DUF5615 family PIN-like protein [Acidimicrobiales bacterium]MCB9404461.1 DUF5615 family PIN-like protein [Microthrixaceae bacterium]